jgi:hypothetical protein
MSKSGLLKLITAAALALGGPAFAQLTPIDPNNVDQYEDDPYRDDPYATPDQGTDPGYEQVDPGNQEPYETQPSQPTMPPPPQQPAERTLTPPRDTIPRDDIFSAAEGVFGKGAEGLAGMIEKILRDQGEPAAYIAGQEAGGAFVLGVRYGSGTMRHQIEGDRPVYWTGPSVGFDAGADANKVFVLVYNLHDSQDLFRRYPAAEGHAYVVGGFTASYLRRGDIVLIPVRLGVGLRLGVNAGYMSFSEKNRWLPF